MALETPNTIVASIVSVYDPTLPAGARYVTRASDGIRSKTEFTYVPGAAAVAYQLEQPVTSDEGVVLAQSYNVALGESRIDVFLAKIKDADSMGNANVDALPINTLWAAADINANNYKVRFSLAVLRLIRP